jgi:PPM family protein phosphatase
MASIFFGITDTGKTRDNNEDAFITEKVLNDQYIMACVIDGVGGYEGGEVAAATAKKSILDYFSVPSGDIITMMKEAIVSANENIYKEKQKDPRFKSMACVLTLALVDSTNNTFYYAHVGDTRLYLLRDQSLVKITKDHSFVGHLEDSGRINEQEAMRHPKRNEIDKALGFGKIAATSDFIETGESPFLPGDIILLCSDGLSDLVSNRSMTSILVADLPLEQKAQLLVDEANNAGGKDNITVVLVYNDSEPVKVKATKPKPVKKKDVPEKSEVKAVATPPSSKTKTKSNSGLVTGLSILSVLLLAALIWALMRNQTKLVNQDSPDVLLEQTPGGKKLQSALDRLTGDTLILSVQDFGNTLQLTDIIFIEQDTLYLRAKDGLRVFADSTYNGPAFQFSANCKHIVLENFSFENFETGIVAESRVLTLKNVRFVNCGMPIQYGFSFGDGEYINGVIKTDQLFKSDSLPKR